MRVEQHRGAREEFLAAVAWYAERNPAKADAFASAFERALDTLERSPQRGAPWVGFPVSSGIRRIRMLRFPYVLAYRVMGDRVVVLACAHMRRRPGYWRARLGRPEEP